MDGTSITFSFVLIFTGAAIFASLALYTRQPLIIAYIALGACIGAVVGILSLLRSRDTRMPFGPYLSLGALVAMLHAADLVRAFGRLVEVVVLMGVVFVEALAQRDLVAARDFEQPGLRRESPCKSRRRCQQGHKKPDVPCRAHRSNHNTCWTRAPLYRFTIHL